MIPKFHLDKDVAASLKMHLNAHFGDPDCTRTAAELMLHRAYDGQHLLAAAQEERILVTHNGKDFITMHDAWVRWSAAWRVTPVHAGILIILQSWRPLQASQEIVQFLAGRTSLPNAIYGYDFDPHIAGWVQNPVPKRR